MVRLRIIISATTILLEASHIFWDYMPRGIKDMITAVMNMNTEDLKLEGFIGDIFETGGGPPTPPNMLMELLYEIWDFIPEELKDVLELVINMDPAELPQLLEGLIGDIFGNLGGFPGGKPPFMPPEIGPPPFPGGEPPFMPPEIGPLTPKIPKLCSEWEGWFTFLQF